MGISIWQQDTALHAAISDVDGKTKLYATNSPVSGGLFKHELSHVGNQLRQATTWQEIAIDCFRLDTLLKDMRLDLVNVEGSELRVLRGSTSILKEGKTRFLVEVHQWADPEGQKNAAEVPEFMRSFGYWPTNPGWKVSLC